MSRVASTALFAAAALAGAVELLRALLDAGGLGPAAALFDTFPSEAAEFLLLGRWRAGAALAAYVAALAACGFAARRAGPRGRAALHCAAASLLLYAAAVPTSAPRELARHWSAYRAENRRAAIALARFDAAFEGRAFTPSLAEQTLVVVIGESTTRRRMGLYGYGRDTTPGLSAAASELIVFRGAVSPHCHTRTTLGPALRGRDAGADGRELEYDLVRLAKAHGYETHWLSNQPPDRGATPLRSAALAADHALWLNPGKELLAPYDELLLEPLERALAGGARRKLVVLHLMGAHKAYTRRYPPEHATFRGPAPHAELDAGETAIFNAYDDAVRYTDRVVSGALARLKAAPGRDKALLYFSDHGEEVLETRPFWGHLEGDPSDSMFEVPLLLWLSPAHAAAGRWRKTARPRLDALYSTADLLHTAHDLLGSSLPAGRDPSRSLLSGSFVERSVRAGEEEYRPRRSVFDPRPRTRNDLAFGRKVWAHRVNTLERYDELREKGWDGFEVDVVVDAAAGRLDVTHPPLPSIGLDFEQYLRRDPARRSRFWLDVKGLEEKDVPALLAALYKLDRVYGLRSRAVVESQLPEAARRLASAGWRASWYAPAFRGQGRWDLAAWTLRVSRGADPSYSALSQAAGQLPRIKTLFPGSSFLTWRLDVPPEDPAVKALAADPAVRIVLVSVPTRSYR